MPPLPAILAFYRNTYWQADAEKYAGQGRAFTRIFLRGRGARGKFLDVGCAAGGFLRGVRDASGWDCHGIEINPDLVAVAREQGLAVHLGTIEDHPYDARSFDFIHLKDIVEHVTDPLGVLTECRALLRPEGRVYLSIPNGDVDVRGLAEFHRQTGYKARSPSGHLWFLGRSPFQLLLRRSGFEIASSWTYGVKKGLRAYGVLPQKSGWRDAYDPRVSVRGEMGFVCEESVQHSDTYQYLRMRRKRFFHIPGLWGIGLDFEMILRPSRQSWEPAAQPSVPRSYAHREAIAAVQERPESKDEA
jgi:SAM-dependent methyltransferase